MPQIPADFSEDCTDFSLKDLSKPLCLMHEYSTDFVKGTSCLMSNIGDAELKIDASDPGKLEVMQQDSKEMETVDEVVEIEKAGYQNYKAEVKTMRSKHLIANFMLPAKAVFYCLHQLFKILILSFLKSLMGQ